MKKLLGIVVLGLLLMSCDQLQKKENYINNCVKDYLEFKIATKTESDAIHECARLKRLMPEKFKYFKGFIFSQPSQL